MLQKTLKEFEMAYSLSCADTGSDCAFSVTTSSENELMQHVQMHATSAHPDMEMTPEAVAQVRSFIRTV
jgi:predicted small metal-binding protein